jgi:AcrR family transcriptional regulator
MDTRGTIMDSAEEVFVARGFSGSSIKSIAEKAGVAKSLLYHYFPSKRDLWEEVIHRRVRQAGLPEKLLETASSVSSEGLDAIREGRKHTTYFEFMRDNPQFVRMLAWLNAERSFPCQPPPGMKEGVLDRLGELQDKGIFRSDIDPRIFVICFMAVCEVWFMSRDRIVAWLGEDLDGEDLSEDYMDAVGKILLEGMAGDR